MKKGFTLVELLAVIVILAVILVIAIPQVLKVVDNSRINAYIKNEEMVLRAVNVYVSRNTGSLPGEIGSTTEVSISYLVSNGMLTEITNPYNKNEDCTGYVTIMKLSDTEYDYTPHLRCGLDIHDSSDDGLVLHYKFDDFQEPTENLMYEYTEYFNGRPFVNVHHGNGHEISSEVDSMFDNMPVYKTWDDGIDSQDMRYPFRFNLNNIDLWDKEVTFSVYIYLPSEFAGRYSNFSAVAYQNTAGSDWHWVRGYNETHNYYGAGTVRTYFSGLDITKYDEWQRVSITFKPLTENKHLPENDNNDDNSQIGGYFKVHVPDHLNNPYHIFVTAPQLEIKKYTTPFVKYVREGNVLDYSGNENHAELDLNTTPRWVYNDDRKGGIYSFDGETNYIHIDGIETGGSMTTMYWIKPFSYHRVTGGLDSRSNNSQQVRVLSDTRLRPRFYDSNGTWHNFSSSYNAEYLMGSWQQHTLVFNKENKTGSLYVNGEKVLEQVFNDYNVGNSISNFVIGSQHNYINTDSVTAKYDDMRIYNRALSDKETKLLYESTK